MSNDDWVDLIPTYAAVDAARFAKHGRALPRMQEQGPWCGDHHIAGPAHRAPVGATVVMGGDRLNDVVPPPPFRRATGVENAN